VKFWAFRRLESHSSGLDSIAEGQPLRKILENLNRVFSQGFTTKHNGHGFGLHGSANAAKEMGGSLSASSRGPDQGATFTLELPIVPIRENGARLLRKIAH